MASQEIENLVHYLAKLPGFGKRSARRSVLHMVQRKDALMTPLIDALHEAREAMSQCNICGNIDSSNPCHVCTDPKRHEEQICVVEEVSDLWAIERSGMFLGRYHVLGGTLSAIEGRGPDDLSIDALVKRASDDKVQEIILATNATVDGQTTGHYITERLKHLNLEISRIAHGIPIGGELDYLDDGTLGAALKARRSAV